jgi:glycosyltransferase involved in cell wall biosynthesis
VLLPCHDAAAYLPDTIASIQAQSFQDLEIIAVDDGSTDATRSLLDEWRQQDPRVRVIRQQPSGIVAALRRAVDAARGDILVRMDADDVAYSNRIQKQVEMLDANPDLGLCGTLVRYFPRSVVQGGAQRYELWINALIEHDDITRDIFVECPVAHPTMAIRRSVLQDVGGYQDHGWPEDYDLLFRLWQRGVRMGKVPEVLLRWRERPDRASRTDSRYDDDAFRRCKVHYLRESVLNGHEDVVIWGAGPVGKALALELQAQHVSVRAFIEVDHRKVNQKIHGVPVVGTDDVDRFRGSLLLAAVGQINGRDEIRATLDASGWVEGSDYVAVA